MSLFGAHLYRIIIDATLANRPLAIGTSSDSWISSSRSLAHKFLKTYIEGLEFDVHEFEDVDDQEWKDYIFFNKVYNFWSALYID